MKPQGPKSIQGPLLRGLAGHSAAGQNDQAAAEQMWLLGLGAGCRKNIPAVPAGRSVFYLTSHLIGLLVHVLSEDGVYLGSDRSNSHTPQLRLRGGVGLRGQSTGATAIFATHRGVAFNFEYLRPADNPPIESAHSPA